MNTLRLTFLPLALAAVALTSPLSAQTQNREAAPGTMGGKTATTAPDPTAYSEASKPLDAGTTVAKTRAAEFATRDDLVSGLATRLDASKTGLTNIENRLNALKGEVRTEFKAALTTTRTRDEQVRKSLDAARNATAENWTEARSNLAADYEAYAASVIRFETVASVGATQSDAKVGAAGTVETKSLEPKTRRQ